MGFIFEFLCIYGDSSLCSVQKTRCILFFAHRFGAEKSMNKFNNSYLCASRGKHKTSNCNWSSLGQVNFSVNNYLTDDRALVPVFLYGAIRILFAYLLSLGA